MLGPAGERCPGASTPPAVTSRVYAARRHQPVRVPTTPHAHTCPNLRPNRATSASLGTGRRGHRAPPTTRATARPPTRTSPLASPPTRAPAGQPASCLPRSPRGSSTAQRTLLGKPKRHGHLQGSVLTTDARHPEDGKRALPGKSGSATCRGAGGGLGGSAWNPREPGTGCLHRPFWPHEPRASPPLLAGDRPPQATADPSPSLCAHRSPELISLPHTLTCKAGRYLSGTPSNV